MIFSDALMYVLIGFIIGYLVSIPITRRNTLLQLQKEAMDFFNSKIPQIKTMDIEIDINKSFSEIEEQLSSHYNLPKEVVEQILDEVKRVKGGIKKD